MHDPDGYGFRSSGAAFSFLEGSTIAKVEGFISL